MRSQTIKRGYFQPTLLVLLGIAVAGLQLTMDYLFGTMLAVQDKMQIVLGCAFVGVDVTVMGLALINGTLFRNGQRVIGTLLASFIFFGAIIAMTATIGFSGAQRFGKTETTEAAHDNAVAFAKAKNAVETERRTNYEQWLRSTVITGATRAIRNDANAKLHALQTAPVILTEVPEKIATADTQAETLVKTAKVFGYNISLETVQVGLILALAIFLTLSQSICFGLASYLWPIKLEKDAAKDVARDIEQPVVTIARSRPALSVVPRIDLANTAEDDTAEDELVARIGPDVDKIKRRQDHVARFLKACTRPGSDASRVTATDIYDRYVTWAQRNDEELHLTQNRFGRICTALHLVRDDADRRKAWYSGLELIPPHYGDEEAALAAVA